MPSAPGRALLVLAAGIPVSTLIPALRQASSRRCQVLLVESAAQAAAALDRGPDVVVLRLPAAGSEPWEQVAALALSERHARVILLAEDGASAPAWAVARGAEAPSDPQGLAAVISTALDCLASQSAPAAEEPSTPEAHSTLPAMARLAQSLDPGDSLIRYCESVADGVRTLLRSEAVEVSVLSPPILVRSPRQALMPAATVSCREVTARAGVLAQAPLPDGQHLVSVPLATARRTYGTLTALPSPCGSSGPAMLAGLSLLASTVGAGLEVLRLAQEHTRSLDELQAISETGRSMVASLDVDQVLAMLAHTALRYVPTAGAALLHVPDGGGGALIACTQAGDEGLINLIAREWQSDEQMADRIAKGAVVQIPLRGPIEGHHPGYATLLVAPLILGQSLVGALSVATAGDAFTERDLRILSSLAGQGAVAIENARLHGRARKADEIAALYELSQALNISLDLRETVTTVLSSARSLTLASSAEIRLASPSGNALEAVIALGDRPESEPGDRYRMSVLYPRLVMESRRPLVIEDTARYENDDEFCRHEAPSWLRSYLGVPLITGQRVVGVLSLGSTRVGAFTSEDLRLLEIAAGQAATALSNARLYEEATQRLREAEAVAQVSRSVAASLEQRTVLDAVVSTLVETVPLARYAFAYLLGADGSPSLAAQAPSSEDIDAAPDVGIWQWCADGCLVRGQPVHLEDTLRHGFPTAGPSIAHSVIAVPMVAGGKAVGVLGTDSTLPNAFTSGDLRLIKTFADQAATAIESARLFDDLNRAYRELSQSTETLTAVFNGITDGMYIVDQEDRLVAVNEPEARFLGSHPESLVGASYSSLYHYGEGRCEHCAVEEALTQGEHVSVLVSYSDREARTVWREVDAYPIRDREGVTNRVVVFARDVTERRRLEASLVESSRMASIGQLASSIAHEVNNPLTVIIGNAEVLLLDAKPEDPTTETIAMILRAARRAARTVQNVLDLSGQQEFEFAEVDLGRTIEEALDLVTYPLRKAGIQSSLEMPEDLPLVTGSAGHLKVVWMNILLNARDAIVASGRTDGEVKVEAGVSQDSGVYVTVSDNGTGMAPEQRSRLFQPFHTTKPAGQGLGLGLYNAYTIVRRHGGRIEVSTQPGEGSVFTVHLPLDAGSGEDLLGRL